MELESKTNLKKNITNRSKKNIRDIDPTKNEIIPIINNFPFSFIILSTLDINFKLYKTPVVPKINALEIFNPNKITEDLVSNKPNIEPKIWGLIINTARIKIPSITHKGKKIDIAYLTYLGYISEKKEYTHNNKAIGMKMFSINKCINKFIS
ncbi:MAG: hypothetical protein ACOC1X_04740 [Promethearchaeota archaeon]